VFYFNIILAQVMDVEYYKTYLITNIANPP